MIHDGPAIHELAHVDHKTCSFGDGTYVWQFASVIRGAKIGQRCVIAACAIVDGAQVGDGCKIGHAASLHPGTRLEKDVFVGPGVVFCNDLWPKVDMVGFEFEALAEKATIVVREGASVGARAVVLPGVVIGPGAMVAAGAVCYRPIPANHILRRDGSIEPIPADREARRMKWAG